jgi:hypothetical protein
VGLGSDLHLRRCSHGAKRVFGLLVPPDHFWFRRKALIEMSAVGALAMLLMKAMLLDYEMIGCNLKFFLASSVKVL